MYISVILWNSPFRKDHPLQRRYGMHPSNSTEVINLEKAMRELRGKIAERSYVTAPVIETQRSTEYDFVAISKTNAEPRPFLLVRAFEAEGHIVVRPSYGPSLWYAKTVRDIEASLSPMTRHMVRWSNETLLGRGTWRTYVPRREWSLTLRFL